MPRTRHEHNGHLVFLRLPRIGIESIVRAMILRQIIGTLGAACMFALHADAASPTSARLHLSALAARPGDTVIAGIELIMPLNHHTYWRNPGDSGQATQIDWHLPKSVTAGDIQWPIPEKLITPPFTTFVYSSNVILLVPLHVATNAPFTSLEISATISWLDCGKVCLPGHAKVLTSLAVEVSPQPAATPTWLKQGRERIPEPETPGSTARQLHLLSQTRWDAPVQGELRPIRIEVPRRLIDLDFYPYANSEYELQDLPRSELPGGGISSVRKSVRRLGKSWPESIAGILVYRAGPATPQQACETTLMLPAN